MKKYIFLAVAAAMACTASAQNNGQLHFVGADGQSRMVKASEIEKITYTGDGTNGFTHMKITVKGSDPQDIALDGVANCEFRGVGLPDTDLHLVAPTSDEFQLLTNAVWKPLGINREAKPQDYFLPENTKDDYISFSTKNIVDLYLGANNVLYDDVRGEYYDDGISPNKVPNTFTFTGKEAFHLGIDADNKLQLQFTNNSFPLMRPGNPALNPRYEVFTLTENELVICTDGKFLLAFNNVKTATDHPNIAKLTAHPWKLYKVWTAAAGEYDVSQCADEVLTFNADGTLTMQTDGTVFNNDVGTITYTSTGNECWSLINDGESIVFGGQSFPIVLSNQYGINGTYKIVELTEDKCTLSVPYWGVEFHIKLIPAE